MAGSATALKPKVNLFLQPASPPKEHQQGTVAVSVQTASNPAQSILNPKTVFFGMVLPMVGGLLLVEVVQFGLRVLARKLEGV